MASPQKPLTIALHTLGCKVNHYETDAAAMRFLEAGFIEVPFDRPADVYLVNTCTVTGEADRKSRQMLRRARSVNPDALVVAMGCHVETADTAAYADVLIGCDGRNRVVELVLDALSVRFAGVAETQPWHTAGMDGTAYEEPGPVTRQSETRAYIKIQDGCDDFCAYCSIPLARGRARSRGRENILAETHALAAAGFAEVVLTGIHIGAYGIDRGEGDRALARLARDVAAVNGISRVRLGSLEPQTVTSGFLEEIAGIPKLCPHFHLSLQSGSSPVLERMNRRYDPKRFLEIVVALRTAFPDAGMTTDVIVGFPGETEAEHKESLAFCERVGFSRMHVFRYSRRKGTAAADMPGQVQPSVAARRAGDFARLADRLARKFGADCRGCMRDVLIESIDADGLGKGYTPEYVSTAVTGLSSADTGRVLSVRLSDAGDGTLYGIPEVGEPA